MKKSILIFVAFMLLGLSFTKAQSAWDAYTAVFNKEGGYGYMYGLVDGTKWSAPHDLPKEQVQALTNAFATNDMTNLIANGIKITTPNENIKYMFMPQMQVMGNNYIAGKKGSAAIVIVKTKQTIFIVTHPNKIPPVLLNDVLLVTNVLTKKGY